MKSLIVSTILLLALLSFSASASAALFDDLFGAFSTPRTAPSGTVTGGSNVGGGVPVFDELSGSSLQFNTLAAGTNITIATTSNDNLLTISSTGSSDPNVILSILGGTTYFQASTTGNAWLFPNGFVSQASSTVDGTLTVTGAISGSNLSGTNTGDITLGGAPDYLSLSGQVLTRALINLGNTNHITSRLNFSNFGQGAARTILANNTGATADFAEVATSSMFAEPNWSWTTIGGTAYIQPTSTLTIFLNDGFISNASSTVNGDLFVNGNATTSQFGLLGTLNCNGSSVLETSATGNIQCGTDDQGAGGTGSNWNFTAAGDAIAPSTTVGIILSASSTVNSTFNLPTLSDGGLVVYGGTVLSNASTTYSGGVAYAAGNVTNTLTAGVGLTRTVDDVFCDNASGSVFGCLLSADWTIFNGKISSTSLSATSPLGYTAATGVFTCTGCLTTVDISANTNLGATWPIILVGDTLTFGGLSTSSDAVVGNIPYFSDVNTFANVATATVSCTTGAACTSFDKIGTGAISITTTLGTAVDLASEITGDLPFANLTQGAAYTILANSTGVTADFAAVSTSSMFKDDEWSWTTIGGGAYIQPTSTLTIFANNGFISNASSTINSDLTITGNATTTNFDITGALTFNGVTASTWAAFCTTITGGAGLCDGTDAEGAGGTGSNFTYVTDASLDFLRPSTTVGLIMNASTTINAALTVGSPSSSSFYWDSINQLLGLGTSSPYAKLSVVGEVVADNFTATSSLPNIFAGHVSASSTMSVADVLTLGGNIKPLTDDGASLGLSAFEFSDLFLNTGGVINFEAGNYTVTHSSSLLTFSGGITASAGTATFGTLAGALDAGGATSFEIPNGTGNTLDAIGEIALDTTGSQLLIATSTTEAEVFGRALNRIFSVAIASTSVAFKNGNLLPVPPEADGYTIYHTQCNVWGGTSVVINFTDNTNDTNTVTCDTATSTIREIKSNNTWTAGEGTAIEIGTITGSPDWLMISAFGVWTRE